jgi:hypothetical protein
MTRRREVKNAVRDVVESIGASVSFEQRGNGHIRATLELSGQHRVISLSCTPSDRSAHKAAAHDARRVLRSMGATL